MKMNKKKILVEIKYVKKIAFLCVLVCFTGALFWMIHFRSQSIKEGIKREVAIEKCMKDKGYFMVRFSDYNTGLMYIISEGSDKGIEVELEGNTPLHSLSNAFRDSKNEFLLYGYEENTDKKATDATLLEDFPKGPIYNSC